MFALQKDTPDDYADSGVITSLTLFTTREKVLEYLESITATKSRWNDCNYYIHSLDSSIEYTIYNLDSCIDSGKFIEFS